VPLASIVSHGMGLICWVCMCPTSGASMATSLRALAAISF
jgi:hypothetical protein